MKKKCSCCSAEKKRQKHKHQEDSTHVTQTFTIRKTITRMTPTIKSLIKSIAVRKGVKKKMKNGQEKE